MPRRATRPGPPTLLLGVWGQGESSPENTTALLDDFIDGAGNVTPKFVVPLSTDDSSDGVLTVFDYAVEKGYDVTVVYTKKPASKALKEVLVAATNEHVAADPITDDDRFTSTESAIGDHFTQLLGKDPKDSRLLFLWAEDEQGEPDEDDQRVLAAVADCGVTALDLSQALEVLDVAPAEPEPEAEPEPDTKDDPEPAGDGEPDFDTVKDWPIRRMKSHAKRIAAAEREEKVPDTPSDDDIDGMNKDAILDYLFPDDSGTPEPEPEPEPEKPSGRRRRTPAEPEDAGKGVTSRRAKEIREDAEAEGKDTLAGEKRRGRAAAKAQEPEETPAEPAEGDDTGETGSDAVSRFREALGSWATALSESDDEAADDAFVDVADSLADVIIDRIAARVNREPEDSAIRQEVAPKRPPGKPRKDGATPTRRRTASR